jgi:hypothetical protein
MARSSMGLSEYLSGCIFDKIIMFKQAPKVKDTTIKILNPTIFVQNRCFNDDYI